jgi:hypothetical protein
MPMPAPTNFCPENIGSFSELDQEQDIPVVRPDPLRAVRDAYRAYCEQQRDAYRAYCEQQRDAYRAYCEQQRDAYRAYCEQQRW